MPVPGDGSAITLFADGTFHAAVRRERPLAAAPATTLDRRTAERIAGERLDALLGTARSQARIVRSPPGLGRAQRHVRRRGAGRAGPGAPPRLGRRGRAPIAPLAERLRALELYLDAGDGALLGGDLLR